MKRLHVERRKRKSHRRLGYLLPSRIIGTLGEDEPKSCKSWELIFTKATNNSGGHSKTTVTRWIEAVLSWILFICSVGIVFSTGRRARENLCGNSRVKTESRATFTINIVVSVAACSGGWGVNGSCSAEGSACWAPSSKHTAQPLTVSLMHKVHWECCDARSEWNLLNCTNQHFSHSDEEDLAGEFWLIISSEVPNRVPIGVSA